MRSFVIRTDKQTGTAKLYTTIRRSNLALRINTLIEVDVKEWVKAHPNKSSEDTSSKYYRDYIRTTEGRRVEEQMDKVDKVISEEMEKGDVRVGGSYDTELIKGRIMSRLTALILDPIKEEEQERQNQIDEARRNARRNDVMRFLYCHVAYLAGFKVEDSEQADTFCKESYINSISPNDYLDRLSKKCKRGMKELDDNKKIARTTFAQWYYFVSFFTKFYEDNPFGWDSLDSSVVSCFVRFLNSRDLIYSSKETRIEYFKVFSNEAKKSKLHKQDIAFAFDDWSKGIDQDEKKTQIYLTLEELDALYNMTDLTENEELVRDVFLIGCYTCQRVSDYSRINKDMIKTSARGIRYIDLRQQKTKTPVAIPLRIFDNDNLVNLLEKYDYNIPYNHNIKCNIDRVIKRLAKRISDKYPSFAEKIPTVATAYEKRDSEKLKGIERDSQGRLLVPKYDLISTHTARRSGITNMFKMGKYNNIQIRAVSGHKSEQVFEEYIKMSGEEFAEAIDRLSQTDANNPITNF